MTIAETGGEKRAALEQVLLDYAAAKNRRDVEAALALCTEDSCYRSTGVPGRVQGKPALRVYLNALFKALPDYFGEFDGHAFRGDTVAIWGRFGGTLLGEFLGAEPTGRRIELPVVFMVKFRDGLIAEDTGYFDAASFLAQAGLAAPGGAAAADAQAQQRAARFVKRFDEAWAARVPEGFGELVHADTQHVYPFMPGPADRQGLIEYFRQVFAQMPDLRLQTQRWATSGDDLFIEWSAQATVAGKPLSWDGTDRFTLRGDKTIAGRAYYDTAPVRAAMKREGVDGVEAGARHDTRLRLEHAAATASLEDTPKIAARPK